jgi:two-component system sensor histidine kinase/response regulator
MSEALQSKNAEEVDVLLVDDQPENLLALEAILEELGENLVRASSGIEALRQVLEHDFAVILMDVRMPGMDGFETARLIHGRPASCHTPIIFLTAYHAADAEMMRGYKIGAVDYLVKPFEANILRSKVALFVELKRKSALIQRQHEELLVRETEARQLAEARLRLQERDIAEHKRFEKELAAARDTALGLAETKSEFLANMSHEIRTPVSSILGLASILLDTKMNAEQLELAREVKDNITALMTIINDILDFSKMSAGKLVFEKIDFELEGTARGALKLVSREAHNKRLQTSMSIAPGVPRILRGDPGRLRQVLTNLLSNAVKFTERGSVSMTVAALADTPAESTLRFEVIDTGIGIAEEERARLFEPFSQLNVSTSRRLGGSGLGLAIARALVERMGGSIGVSSTPGAGSTFWFNAKFPKPPAGQVEVATAAVTFEGQSVLVVDDDQHSRETIKCLLESWKAAVDAVPCAAQAIKAMRERAQQGRPYSIALLDADSKAVGALELARMIRGTPEIVHTTVLLLSSNGECIGDHNGLGALNITACLQKPVTASVLYDFLTGVLSAKIGLPPLETAAATAAEVPLLGIAGKTGRKPHVLLAEDNASNRRVALWQLDKLGCSADAATNGIEVLEALARSSYDVVLMDCRMPRMDGYQTTREIRRHENPATHIPIVAMTAHAMEPDRKKCLDCGMDDYLSKPVTLESLAATLRRVLAGKSANASSPPAAAQQEGAPAPVLDPATMASLRAKVDLLPALIETVLTEIPEQIKQLGDALARHDHAEAAIAAHSLKGTARIFGAGHMEQLAGGVEQAADAEQFEQAAAELEPLSQECARVSRELESERVRPAAETH